MKGEKVTVSWNTEEGDWNTRYPEWKNRNPRILGLNILSMIGEFKNGNGESLRDLVLQAGFNPDKVKLSVPVKKCVGKSHGQLCETKDCCFNHDNSCRCPNGDGQRKDRQDLS